MTDRNGTRELLSLSILGWLEEMNVGPLSISAEIKECSSTALFAREEIDILNLCVYKFVRSGPEFEKAYTND